MPQADEHVHPQPPAATATAAAATTAVARFKLSQPVGAATGATGTDVIKLFTLVIY
jgi:hypothetical protein